MTVLGAMAIAALVWAVTDTPQNREWYRKGRRP